MQKIWLAWNQTQYPINWSSNPYTWEEVAIVIEVGNQFGYAWSEPSRKFNQGITGPSIKDLEDKLPKDKLEFFIKVVCKVNDLNYEDTKMRKTKPQVSVEEITKTFEEIHKVRVSLKSFPSKDI